MKTKLLLAAIFLPLFVLHATALDDATPRIRMAMLSDGGTFLDGSFNQFCREGLESLLDRFPIYANFVETSGPGDYSRSIAEMAERNYRLIIGIGYRMAAPIEKMAAKYPHTYFATVDGGSTTPPVNVRSLLFSVDQCAFPAGYLAAAWADLQDPEDAAVGFVGGMEVDSVRQFTEAFRHGAEHYNRVKGRSVRVLGEYAGTFQEEARGLELGAKLIEQGAEVLFGVGSLTGNGAIRAAKEAGKWAIGVDMDQYYILSDVSDILLTSCVKRMDRAVAALAISVCENEFWGGGIYEGTLNNHGVALAPYHDMEDLIPEETKAEVKQLLQDIARGQQSTGWGE